MGCLNSRVEYMLGMLWSGNVAIRWDGELGHMWKSGRGLLQGCPLSPLLYAVSCEPFLAKMRELQEEVQEDAPAELRNKWKLGAYVDDIAIIINNAEELREV